MAIKLAYSEFSPYRDLEQYQRSSSALPNRCGATACFIGSMRDFNEGERVAGMFLEHYPGMTESCLETICVMAQQRWKLLDCLIIHRVGEISLNEPIVLVAVWSSHRGDALDACRYIIDELKQRAPFWKQEFLDQGSLSRWVSHNSDGYASSEHPSQIAP